MNASPGLDACEQLAAIVSETNGWRVHALMMGIASGKSRLGGKRLSRVLDRLARSL